LLNSEENTFYQSNGFVKLSTVFTQTEVAEMSSEYDKVFKRKAEEKANIKAIWKGDWEDKIMDKSKHNSVYVQSVHNLQVCFYESFTKVECLGKRLKLKFV
jgi:hypothetical protein